MTRALVIGAGGQIGSDLVPALQDRGHEVWMFDRLPVEETRAHARLSAALVDHPGWRKRWRAGDAGDAVRIRDLIDETQPDVVFHLAALLSATGEANPGLCWDLNMGSLRHVLESLASMDDRRQLIWPSSIAAFGPLPGVPGGYPPGPVPNEYPMLPTTMYGVTKVAGELLGRWYARHGDVDFRCVRFPGLLNCARPGGGSSDYANEMYFAAAEGRPSVSVFVRPDSRIPFMHMADAVDALIELSLVDEDRLTRRVYNVGSFAPTADEIAESIRRYLAGQEESADLEVSYEPDHRQAFVDSWPNDIDDTPARKDWGWQPSLDLDATTARLIAEIHQL